ncbi:unnamed protein product [Angiostrongylus costaricensis]|uniref:Serine/threonine-protein kinase LATS2 n=1 Tax=Angiostrongylus costaricensis TaxID=334426 RepID=A0A158PGZ6_ANGCS|nr:unnamed protein product [Angiostrongylus costaricensis]
MWCVETQLLEFGRITTTRQPTSARRRSRKNAARGRRVRWRERVRAASTRGDSERQRRRCRPSSGTATAAAASAARRVLNASTRLDDDDNSRSTAEDRIHFVVSHAMRANGHERYQRNDNNMQDVRVGRHRDKLELIRDSLRPFEQTVGDIVPVTAAEQNVQHSEMHLTVVESATNSGALGQQRAMVDSLIAQGYDQDAAFYALKLVKFASTAAAVDVLKHINHDHANMEGKSDRLLSVIPPSAGSSSVNGNHTVQSSKIPNGVTNGNLYPAPFVTNEDSASSRSTSPLPPQLPSPTAAIQPFVTSSGHVVPSTSSLVSMAGSSTIMTSQHSAGSTAATSSVPSNSPQKALIRQYVPVAPDYHRTHVHISTTPYAQDFYQQQVRPQKSNFKPSIYIERGAQRPSDMMKQHYVVRDTYKSPLDSSISAPMGQSTSHVQIGGLGASPLARYGQQPPHAVIRTTFSAAPLKSMVNINVSPINKLEYYLRTEVLVDFDNLSTCNFIYCEQKFGTGSPPLRKTGGVTRHRLIVGIVVIVKSVVVQPEEGEAEARVVANPAFNSCRILTLNAFNKATETRTYRLDVTGRDGVSSVHGIPGSVTGVQNIIVDPDKSHRGFVAYEDELRHNPPCVDVVPSTSKEQPHPVKHERLERTYGVSSQYTPSRGETSHPTVNRCTSPLPESISNRLKQQKYEKYVKPCKPRMFCFFMEQHVERLLAQYKERMKRAHQHEFFPHLLTNLPKHRLECFHGDKLSFVFRCQIKRRVGEQPAICPAKLYLFFENPINIQQLADCCRSRWEHDRTPL